jgi:hypothetical protein
MSDKVQRSASEVSEGALWFGLLGSHVAWLLHLALSYPLVPLSCALEWGMIFHLISLVMVLAAVASLTVAWQSRQQLRHEGANGTARYGRQSFMALFGLLSGVLFLAVILAQWLPVFFIPPCS